ncbi:MAG: hypothetical protein ACRDQF_08250, partial [Thermocrispum sp.]
IALIVLMIAAMTVAANAHQHGGTHVDKAETVLAFGVAGLISVTVLALSLLLPRQSSASEDSPAVTDEEPGPAELDDWPDRDVEPAPA